MASRIFLGSTMQTTQLGLHFLTVKIIAVVVYNRVRRVVSLLALQLASQTQSSQTKMKRYEI